MKVSMIFNVVSERNVASCMHYCMSLHQLMMQLNTINFTALLLMDLRKAFDTVFHQILSQKLLHYGIRGPAYCLIESYLSNRQQFVSINNSASSLKSISIGVPQAVVGTINLSALKR